MISNNNYFYSQVLKKETNLQKRHRLKWIYILLLLLLFTHIKILYLIILPTFLKPEKAKICRVDRGGSNREGGGGRGANVSR